MLSSKTKVGFQQGPDAMSIFGQLDWDTYTNELEFE